MGTIRKYLSVIVQGLLLGFLTAVIVISAQQAFSPNGYLRVWWKELTFDNTLQAAFLYQKRNVDYVGVCEDTAFPGYIYCIENGDAFKIEMRLADDSYLCADSRGNKQILWHTTGDALVCE